MSASSPYDGRTLKAKRPAANPPPVSNPGHSGPTTFFLRSERDMENGTPSRGRKMSRASDQVSDQQQNAGASTSSLSDSSFGVQTLEDAISESVYTDSSLSRTESNEGSPAASRADGNTVAGRKRKAGNPVHPKIMATGNRIISSEQPSAQASSAASPLSLRSAESPFRTHLRRASNSSLNLGPPLTPLRYSPHPDSAMPSTPRSASLKSFRLSDEEASVASETNSQVIQSSSEEGDDVIMLPNVRERDPQLVMPSITMPTRRPFTHRGRHMGKLKVMVVGPSGVGKTSLIKSIFRTCEDIVHIDPVAPSTMSQSTTTSKQTGYESTTNITEIHASTKPYPLWWSDMESSRSMWRRKSFGEGILERNLCFIDTPGVDSEELAERILREVETLHMDNARMDTASDNQLLNLFSGEGGSYIDAVLYLCEAGPEPIAESEHEFMRKLASLTNLIPLIARADGDHSGNLNASREKVREVLSKIKADWYSMVDINAELGGLQSFELPPSHSRLEPFAISSAITEDNETMDASLLMASDYLQPLAPSDLSYFLDRFLSPGNITRMRHLSAKKFLLWRKQNLGIRIDLPKQTVLHSPQFSALEAPSSPAVTGTGSLLDDPSKVLVPYGSSNFFRSASPSSSDFSGNALLPPRNDTHQPFGQVRVAKWAHDLRRSLRNDWERYGHVLPQQRERDQDAESGAPASYSEKEQALTTTTSRPPRGKLGGEMAVLDPLGILAATQSFRRGGWIALQVAGGLGVVGSVCWWVLRNWAEAQQWLGMGGVGQQGWIVGVPVAVPAPTGERGWWEGWL